MFSDSVCKRHRPEKHNIWEVFSNGPGVSEANKGTSSQICSPEKSNQCTGKLVMYLNRFNTSQHIHNYWLVLVLSTICWSCYWLLLVLFTICWSSYWFVLVLFTICWSCYWFVLVLFTICWSCYWFVLVLFTICWSWNNVL